MTLPIRTVLVGGIPWTWSVSVVASGPDGRLIVTRGMGETEEEARRAVREATRMEWRCGRGLTWQVELRTDGLRFSRHLRRVGPVAAPPGRPVAELTTEELEALLRRGEGKGGEG